MPLTAAKKLLLFGRGAALLPSPNYHVSKTGDDTTGDGSSNKPWLTLAKACTVVAGGDVVGVGDGVYAENSGPGYWNITLSFLSTVTFQPERGAAGNVVVTGATFATANVLFANNAKNIKFRYITFTHRLATTLYCVRSTNTISNITFDHCAFVQVGDGSTLNYGLYFDPGAGKTQNNVVVDQCTFTAVDNKFTPISLGANGGGVITNFAVNLCTVHGGFNAAAFNGCTSATINGGVFTSMSSSAIRVGADAASGGNASTVTINNCMVDMTGAAAGHCILVGNGAVNCVVDGVVALAFNEAVVLKEHGAAGGTEVKNCTLSYTGGGSGAAILHKAAQNSNVHNNTLLSNAPGLGVFYFTAGDTGNKNSNNNINHNIVTATGTGVVFFWNAASDAGGNINDYNTYTLASGGWGEIPTGVVAVPTIAALRTAWSGYGDGSNDSHSS